MPPRSRRCRHPDRLLVTSLTTLLLAVLCAPDPGHAAFPGRNGDIAIVELREVIHTLDPETLASTQLTDGEPDMTPAWSPDGRRIVFSHADDDGGGLFIDSLDGSAPNRLTTDSTDRNPSWSPDGRQIVFDREVGDGDSALFKINTDRSNITRLTPSGSAASDRDPAWSPDGRLIAFVREEQIMLMNADGSARRSLTRDHFNMNPAWSPDGNQIAFARYVPPPKLPQVPPPSSPVSPPPPTFFPPFSPPPPTFFPLPIPPSEPFGAPGSFSFGTISLGSLVTANVMLIAQSAPVNTGFDIYRMDSAGGALTRVVGERQNEVYPAWSPDGTMIAFERSTAVGDPFDFPSVLAELPPSRTDIYRVRANGTSITRLTNTGSASQPDWQPILRLVTLDPDLEFGNQRAETSSEPQTATLTNTGAVPVSVVTVAIEGQQAADFEKGNDNCTGKTLAPGASCSIGVLFRPSGPGEKNSSLSVTSNASGSPHRVDLHGVGMEEEVPAGGSPQLALIPPLGPPGFVTRAVGTGFPPGAMVSLEWEPGIGGTTVTAGPSGQFSVPVLVFYKDSLGYRELRATPNSGAEWTALEATFLVRPGSGQPRRMLGRR